MPITEMQDTSQSTQDGAFPGLDFDFLRYMGVTPENQRRIQGYYLPYFAGCRKVVDLGCGDGDFVALLRERGIDAVGVDGDPKAHQAAARRGLPVIESDVFAYLAQVQAGSVDGIFCAHLVEHLPYPQVIALVRGARRALRPGGTIILATPNVRSLFSHLEMFYLHFGHISFYHPNLLAFFLEHEGFVAAQMGENPETASPLMPGIAAVQQRERRAQTAAVSYRPEIAPQGRGLVAAASYRAKRWLTGWLLRPYLDDLAGSTNRALAGIRAEQALLNSDMQTLAGALRSLNGTFECYAIAYVPGRDVPGAGAGRDGLRANGQ